MPPSVSVVVPMYNEEAYVARVVRAARDVLQAWARTGRSCWWTTPPRTAPARWPTISRAATRA